MPSSGPSIQCTHAIDPIAREWDSLVPRDLPHLRSGFLRTVERGEMLLDPAYLTAYHSGRLAGVAFAYTVMVDTTAAAPPHVQERTARIRERSPGHGWRPMRICGSPISNSECGVYFDPQLDPEVRRPLLDLIVRAVVGSSRLTQTILFKDFAPEAVDAYASGVERRGFFSVAAGPGTVLHLRWSSFEDYLNAMHKKYRGRIRKDLKAAAGLEFTLLDAFAGLAAPVTTLYLEVLSQAKFVMEKATERFFSAVSEFDQAKLLVARQPSTGELLGANLLLFGDTCMHNLYIGFDYATNEQYNTYFALVEHSIRVALERKCRTCYFGPGSYEFKARLGATPVVLASYMKNRFWPVHYMLRSVRSKFPKGEMITHDVFHETALVTPPG